RRHPDHRRPDLLPGARTRTHRRASRDERRHRLLIELSGVTSMETMKLQKRASVSALVDPKIVGPAIRASFTKLDPRVMVKNPVMFVVEIVAALTTVIFLRDLVTGGEHLGFTFQIILWLWFTVLFANFAEAVAEGRGKGQADTLRKTRTESQAKLLSGSDGNYRLVP